MPRVVIVGGGFGGLYAVRSLRRVPVDVTLVGPDNNEVFLFDDLANNAVTPPQFNTKIEDEGGVRRFVRD